MMNEMMNLNTYMEEEENDRPMRVAAESLVHFADADAPRHDNLEDDDGLLAMEVARAAEMCIMEQAS